MLAALGTASVQRHNHDLAWAGARALAERWRTSCVTPEAMVGTMATLLLPESLGTSRDDALRLRAALLDEDGIEVQVHAFHDRVRVRISAQIYNDHADIERLGEAVARRA
jgi:isopenicillin-N epimerase